MRIRSSTTVDPCIATPAAPLSAVIDNAVKHHVRGIIMDGYGGGSYQQRRATAVMRAQKKGVVVVITSRVGSGRVQKLPEPSRTHTITGDNLPPEKARLLLRSRSHVRVIPHRFSSSSTRIEWDFAAA